eukprot:1874336-Rhodomonas_salina.1
MVPEDSVRSKQASARGRRAMCGRVVSWEKLEVVACCEGLVVFIVGVLDDDDAVGSVGGWRECGEREREV